MKYKPILYGSVHATSCEPETLPVINSGKIITVLLRGPNYVCLWNHLFRYSFLAPILPTPTIIYLYIYNAKKNLGMFSCYFQRGGIFHSLYFPQEPAWTKSPRILSQAKATTTEVSGWVRLRPIDFLDGYLVGYLPPTIGKYMELNGAPVNGPKKIW